MKEVSILVLYVYGIAAVSAFCAALFHPKLKVSEAAAWAITAPISFIGFIVLSPILAILQLRKDLRGYSEQLEYKRYFRR